MLSVLVSPCIDCLKYSNIWQLDTKVAVNIKKYQKIVVEFMNMEIHVYPLIDKLYRNYQIYRNSSRTKRAAVYKISTPGSVASGMDIF